MSQIRWGWDGGREEALTITHLKGNDLVDNQLGVKSWGG